MKHCGREEWRAASFLGHTDCGVADTGLEGLTGALRVGSLGLWIQKPQG